MQHQHVDEAGDAQIPHKYAEVVNGGQSHSGPKTLVGVHWSTPGRPVGGYNIEIEIFTKKIFLSNCITELALHMADEHVIVG